MSQDEMKALAQRAVECKGWRWLPGMALTEVAWSLCSNTPDRRRVVSVSFFGSPMLNKDDFSIPGRFCVTAASNGLPDLTDPATLGCLLALVCEAWGDDGASVIWQTEGWFADVVDPEWPDGERQRIGPHHTRAHAHVAALEAAP